jgi:hypothetical protein
MDSLCQYAADQIVRGCRIGHCSLSGVVCTTVKDLLEHSDARLQQAGIELLDHYLKKSAGQFSNDVSFSNHVRDTPEMFQLVLTALNRSARLGRIGNTEPAVDVPML